MSKPLLDKFEEIYGEKPETTEETTEENSNTIGDLKFDTTTNTLMVGNGSQYLTTNNIASSSYITGTGPVTQLGVYSRTVAVPYQTNMEQQFYKVLKNIEDGKAVITEITAGIDSSFTGFGGQIRYTVEILAHYP